MIIGDIETTEKIEYEDLLKNYYEKMEIIEEQDKEIEKLKEELEYTIPIVEHNKTITKHLKEIERLNNIINEAKEFIGHNYFVVGRIEKIYKILDKEVN